jgi:hypothetical protein
MSLEQLRDIVIVVYGVVGILLIAVLIMVAIALLVSVRALTRVIKDLVNDPIRPILGEVQATAREIRGTSEFVADSAVHPLIRVMAAGRGIKRGLAVVTGLAVLRRKRGQS